MNILFAIGAAIGLTVGVAASTSAWLAYDRFIDNPRVVREAREQYVNIAEIHALTARQDAEFRRREKNEAALRSHTASLVAANANLEEELTRIQQDNLDYEKKLAALGRKCDLDADDIVWLRNK